MAFTLAHPAAVAPLWYATGRRLPLAALVFGAMSPDFEYLFRLAPRGSAGHDFVGIVAFCVPASLGALFLFETIVRAPFARLLGLPPRIVAGPERTARWWAGAAVASLLGAATHVVWDAFTHGDGWMVLAIAGLRAEALWGMAWFSLLQRLSTLAGAIVIAVWLASSRHALRSARIVAFSRRRRRIVLALLAVAFFAALANGVRAAGIDPDRDALVRFLAFAAVGGMDGLALVVLGYGLWWRAAERRAPVSSCRSGSCR
ncbi:MAG: DUF4184 family protein [Candidatus Binatia bacterium]